MSKVDLLNFEYSEGIGTYGPIVLKNGRAVSQSVVARDIESLQDKLEMAYAALKGILDIPEADCELYVRMADEIAMTAIALLETE